MAGTVANFVLGTFLVGLYASDRFNTPPTNRSSTTAARYYTAAGLYLCVAIGIYALFLFAFPQLLHHWEPIVIEQFPWAKELSAPLLLALLLTVSLPRVPILSNVDEWIRKKLQHMAAIPYEVRRLSVALRRSPFHVPDERQEEIRAGMLAEGLQPSDILFQESTAPQYLWAKIAALMKSLEDWESHPRFSGFVACFSADLDALRTRYKQLVPKARNCFRLIRDHAPGHGDGQTDDAVSQFRADFVEQAKDLLHSMYDFIGRGVLQCKLTHGARCEQLEALGFRVELPRPKLTVNELVALFMLVTVVLMFGFVSRQSVGQNASTLVLFGRSLTISAIYCVAIWWALYPKGRWALAKRDGREIRPVASYLLVSLLASGTGLAINLIFKLLIVWDWTTAWEQSSRAWPWTLMTFATTVVTAWLTDNRPSATWPAPRLRWLEGLGVAAVLILTAWGVHLLLGESIAGVQLLSRVLRAGVIGFSIGFLVPTWYRDAPRRREESQGLGEPLIVKTGI